MLDLSNNSTPKRFAAVATIHQNASQLNNYQQKINGQILAMTKAIENCYQTTGGGHYLNIATDDQILIALPFSGTGHKAYGEVSVSSARALRLMVLETVKLDEPMPLFLFNEGVTRWFLQRDDYPTERSALKWLQAVNFGLDEFVPAWRRVTNARSAWKRPKALTATANPAR